MNDQARETLSALRVLVSGANGREIKKKLTKAGKMW